jgi:dehydrogenase/reductase SDR family member 1
MILLFRDRATWQTILAMLHTSPGVARGSFGEYRLGSLHQQHPHRHPPGDRRRRRQDRHPVLPRRPAAVVCDYRDRSGRAGRRRPYQRRAEPGRAAWILLVNNAWGGYEQLHARAWEEWNATPRQQPLDLFDAMFTEGLRTHSAALAQCAPLLITTQDSQVVIVSTAIPGSQAAPVRRGTRNGRGRRRPAGPGRSGVRLREHGVASIAVHPGWVPTEGVMQYADRLDMTGSQSPEQVGRAIAALADDSDLLNLTGRTLSIDAPAQR